MSEVTHTKSHKVIVTLLSLNILLTSLLVVVSLVGAQRNAERIESFQATIEERSNVGNVLQGLPAKPDL